MDTIAMTQKELIRLELLSQVRDGRRDLESAAKRLDLSVRQARRLLRKLQASGAKGLAHGNRGRAAANRTAPQLAKKILRLHQVRYFDFNDTHFQEMLQEKESIFISRECLRALLRANGHGPKRKRRAPRHHRRRLRAAEAGILALWDGSPHPWFGLQRPACTLMAAVDDSDTELLAAFFVSQESSAAYLRLLDAIVRKKGVPLGLYQDRHSALKRNDPHWTLEEQLAGEQDPTQVGMALRDLGIRPIFALSPQAKGRIERHFGIAQDRLVAEMRLAGVRTPEAGNRFLEEVWIERFNRRFARKSPSGQPGAYRSSAKLDLRRIFSFRYTATVQNDNTVSLGGKVISIPPGPGGRSYAKARVDARQHLDGGWSVYYHDRQIAEAPPSELREPLRMRRHDGKTRIGHQDFVIYPPNENLTPADIFARQ